MKRTAHRDSPFPWACARTTLVAAGLWLATAGQLAWSAAPPVAVGDVQPVNDLDEVWVERTEGQFKGDPDGWRMNMDVWLQNTTDSAKTLEKVRISYNGGSNPGATIVDAAFYLLLSGRGVIPEDENAGLAANEIPRFTTRVAFIPEQRVLPFPLPDTVTVELYFESYVDPLVITRPLQEYVSRTPAGSLLDSYAFPGARKDLLPGEYWYMGKSHTYQSHHRRSTRQRFAEDWGVRRWTGSRWSGLLEGGTGSTNADFLIWNMPIYAVANGEIVRCANGFPDNPTPPDKLSGLTDNPPTIPPGGNNLWIEHVTGEIVLYAHFRQGTIPEHLCPDDPGLWVHDVDPGIPVVAGQYLGRVGNSGESTAPHLHIHSELKATQTGLPLYYHNVDSFGEWAYDPAADPGPPWNEVVDAAISSHEVVPDPGTEAGAFALPGRRANLGIVQTTTPRPAIAGRSWSATFDLTNHGPDATPGVTLVHVLPPAFEHASDTADCEKSPAGSTLTCVIGTLAGLGPAGEESGWAVDVTADIPADLVYNNGGPVTLMSNAYVEGDRLDDSALNNVSLREVRILAESDQILESVEMISSPPKMLVGETAEVTLKVRVRSVGPSSPMDLKITWDPPSQVVPASPEIAVPAMKSGEVREVPVTMTVGCSGFGEKRVRVGAMLAPVSVNDRDPDWTNNEGRVLLAYECVLPVAINIKPGGAPNAIQAGKGNVPFAILTTGAGEYGLPLAVDALTIDDASVRFGGRDLVWTGTGGAAERHKQGHIEDSYELDDETMDGDMDLLIDVRTEDTGLTVDSTEACAAGTFDWFGLPIRFFGCDEIRMVDNNPRGSLE